MAKIESMKMLRDTVLKAIEDLEDGKIDIAQAAVISKMSDSVIAGLKSEMQYALLTNQEPNIPFYGEGSGIVLTNISSKKLLG